MLVLILSLAMPIVSSPDKLFVWPCLKQGLEAFNRKIGSSWYMVLSKSPVLPSPVVEKGVSYKKRNRPVALLGTAALAYKNMQAGCLWWHTNVIYFPDWDHVF